MAPSGARVGRRNGPLCRWLKICFAWHALKAKRTYSGTALATSPIGRRLAISFSVVSLLAAVLSIVNVLLMGRLAGSIAQMQDDEHTIRAGLDLAKAVREQYIHAAHNIGQGDRSHLDHYSAWVARVEKDARRLSKIAPRDEQHRLARIIDASREFDVTFRRTILPAIERGDAIAVRNAHAQVEPLIGRAADDADALAQRFEQRMSHAHVSSTGMTRLGLSVSAVGILLIVLFAVFSTFQIRRAVIEPLARLARAAVEIGKGQFGAYVGEIGDGEFRELGQAFDRMSAELQRREAQLVQSERMAAIGQLAAGVAHEINNPIGVIRGYLRTMLPDAADPQLREELQILDEEAAACQRIADDLLAYARLPELNKQPVAIHELIEDVLRRIRSTHEEAPVTLQASVEPGLIEADPVRLRQVVSNLVKNAIEAGSAEVEVVGEQSQGTYRVRVLDRGPGIPEDQRERVFEPFFSGRGGTGLGLPVCLGIAKAHGGTIVALPRAGGGSELVVTVPV